MEEISWATREAWYSSLLTSSLWLITYGKVSLRWRHIQQSIKRGQSVSLCCSGEPCGVFYFRADAYFMHHVPAGQLERRV